MLIKDGFPGERLRVLPRSLVTEALDRAPTSGLLVTDVGYFPHAAHHGRRRNHGTPSAIVIVCTEGKGWCQVGERRSNVLPGEALVIPPAVPHMYGADLITPWTIWWIHLAGRHIGDFLDVILAEGRETLIDLHDSYRIVSTLDNCIRLLEQDDTLPNVIAAAGDGWSLLAQLASDRIAGKKAAEPVRQAQDFLRRNLGKSTPVPELARMAGLSVSHFSTLFRSATGVGVVEYTKRLRMSRARELLLTTSWSVTDIAHAVGYGDALYFSRQFRNAHGCSPTDYRSGGHEPRAPRPADRADLRRRARPRSAPAP